MTEAGFCIITPIIAVFLYLLGGLLTIFFTDSSDDGIEYNIIIMIIWPLFWTVSFIAFFILGLSELFKKIFKRKA
jgi:hypothetical protein